MKSSTLGEILCIILLVLQIVTICLYWSTLPDKVPSHFGLSGAPDYWGAKQSLFMLPIVSVILYALFTFIAKVAPMQKQSNPIQILQSQIAVMMLFSLKTWILIMLSVLNFSTIQIALHRSTSLGWYTMPFFLSITFIIIIISLIKMLRLKSPNNQ